MNSDFSSIFTTHLNDTENVKNFCCTDEQLNDFFQNDALSDHRNLYSITHLVKQQDQIIGFFTLITDTIDIKNVDGSAFSDYQYSKLPAIKIARLATHKDYEGRGIGKYMIASIFEIVSSLTRDVGCSVITVDAKQNAIGFYKKYAFSEAKSRTDSETKPMYLNIRQLIQDSLS
jgi:GNAT superfamily N-acetyltransferase